MGTQTTKDKILQAALGLLEKSGIKAVTQPAVAKLVGIPQGQLTYHFPRRADLVLAVTDLSLDRLASFLFSRDAVTEKMDRMLWKFLSDPTRSRALLGLVVETDESPEVRERLAMQEEKGRSLIAAALGLEEGDPDITLVHATLAGFALLAFLRADKPKTLETEFYASMKKLRSQIKKPKREK